MRHPLPALVLCFAVSLAACGQKGPLTLPSRAGGDTVAAEPGEPAGESAEASEDDEDRRETGPSGPVGACAG